MNLKAFSIIKTVILAVAILASGKIFAYGTSENSVKLSGSVIGTESCYDYSTGSYTTKVNTPANAFDGDLSTFVATANNSNTWVGLDLGTPHVITQVGWSPRNASNGGSRVVLGLFEGANQPDFLDAVPLYLISEEGKVGVISHAPVNVSRGFRYVRYCGPHGSRTNIAEIEFYGYEGEGDDSQFYQVTNIPTLSYHTYKGTDPTSKTTELEANMCLIYDEGSLIQEYPILARIRGNASAGFEKKPYRIRFNDGKSHHIMKGGKLESPAKARKWTLINNYGDKTLMRNILSFEISRRLNQLYTPYCQPVDLIVNGEYKGCYQLCDQITADENRVPIVEMEKTDIAEPEVTGGYLVEVDAYAGSEKSMFTSNKGIPVTIKEPGEDDIVKQQSQYIKNFFNLMETSLWSSNYTDAETGYRSKIDLDSFIKLFLVGEFSGNTDTFWSTYMYKNRQEDIFHVSPSWDFDLAWDNDNRIYPVNNHSDWIYRSGGSCAGSMSNFVTRILSDKFAMNRMESIWADARESSAITVESLLAYIDSTAQVLDQSQRLNFLRWPILNSRVHQNAYALGDYGEEVKMVKKCVSGRVEWFDNKLNYGKVPEDDGRTEYDIATANDLLDFMYAVNSHGKTTITGRLKNDLDMSTINSQFMPIGTASRMFAGVFDGQGHTIRNLNISTNSDYVGLFGYVAGGAEIKNFTLDKSCSIKGNAFVGIIGGSNSSGTVLMENLGNEGIVTSTNQNAGGIIGCNMNSSASFIINNCYVTGSVMGGHESAAISGWVGSGAVITNTWSIATVKGNDGGVMFVRSGNAPVYENCFDINGSSGTIKISSQQISSGELCYLLNQKSSENVTWYQTLGFDEHPVLDSSHGIVYKEGDAYTNGSFAFKISSPEDLARFAKSVNGGRNKLNADLVVDLDLKDLSVEPIGTIDRPYLGSFDGHNHILSNLHIERDADCTGLFGAVAGGAEIKNLTLDSSCSIIGKAYTGLIGACKGEGVLVLSNLGNEGTVKGSGINAAGILGCNLKSETSLELVNCYTSGSITGSSESGSISGWLGYDAKVANCYNVAALNGYQTGKPFARFDAGKPATFTNCYDAKYTQSKITKVTTSKLQSGEVCMLLNEGREDSFGFFQTLGVDMHPVLAHHAVVLKDGTSYTNKQDYEISNVQDLMDFAVLVNSGLPSANATLVSDIDGSGLTLKPIGNSTYKYCGTFDGQDHILSNITISGENYTALLGMVTGGCVVQNMTMDKTCSVTGNAYVAGFVGGSNGGGTVTMNRLGFEGRVVASAQNAGGIAGCDMSSAAKFVFNYCYVTGSIVGDKESGALSGWVGSNAVVNHCYSIADVTGTDGSQYLVRGTASTMSNSYALSGNAGIRTSLALAKSGNLCYLLNDKSTTSPVYRQNLGEDNFPVLLSDHKIVGLGRDGKYMNIEQQPDINIERIEFVHSKNVIREGASVTLEYTIYPEDASNKNLNWSSSDEKVATVKDGVVQAVSPGTVTITAKANDKSGVEARCEIEVISSTYEIENASQLMAFAAAVNGGMTDLNARLMGDIDMKDVEEFQPIGNSEMRYVGTFDGQGHTIDNLHVQTDYNYTGMFGVVGGGVVIQNFVLGKGCSIRGAAYCGIVGTSLGAGNVTLQCLGNEGVVTAAAQNAGGIIGCNMGSEAHFIINNCYVTGTVSGGNESASLSGWVGNNAEINSCWSDCEVEGIDGDKTFIRGSAQLVNCYSTYGKQVQHITSQDIAYGALCWNLNGQSSANPVWYQKLGEDMHPVFDSSRGIIYKVHDGFSNDPNGTSIQNLPEECASSYIYGINGIKHSSMKSGINIIRMNDGSVKKISRKR